MASPRELDFFGEFAERQPVLIPGKGSEDLKGPFYGADWSPLSFNILTAKIALPATP
ncbi:hypothetical protein MASR2M79_08910 [Aminivibrio sp.]